MPSTVASKPAKAAAERARSAPATDQLDRLLSGAVSATDLAERHLAEIEQTEPEIQAWAWHDPDFVRQQAAALDAHRKVGRGCRRLHGLAVGIKDIHDTARIPSENGTPLDAGRVPNRDAALVGSLKAAGAIVAGKTATTELAYLFPARTTNPSAPGRSPGGSSSGSAAAVAAGHVPLAVGTQTGGSVIRPAAYCGVVGYKPSFGAIPRTGVLTQSPFLDTVGVFARTVTDAALLAEVLWGYDSGDPATAVEPAPPLLETARSEPPVAPVFALVEPPGWDQAAGETHAAMADLEAHLGEHCLRASLPSSFEEAAAIRERINFAEMAKCYYGYERRGREHLSDVLCEAIDAGKSVPARDYIAALDWRALFSAGIEEILERADAILTPAAPGPAPLGLESTGSGIFNGLWTLTGMPAITVPVFETGDGAPMGLQLVGRRGDDARLLRSANALMREITG